MIPSPLGIKLELTHRCNLRCAFCYTDSPRHTLARTPDLTEDQWLGLVDEAIDLGVIEAVVTGGEPFMRRDLTLAAIRRLGSAGVAVNLNTNGWFVDAEIAGELAEVGGIHVHVSVDGESPDRHDAARGVPGSWRRAIEAIDHLLSRSVTVSVVHVVTPENEAGLDSFLDQMWWLGVRTVRITPVAPVGAATRGEWQTDRAALVRRAAAGRDGVRVLVHPEDALADERLGDAPMSLLIRPNGAVRLDSLHPFSFGTVPSEALADCWARVHAESSDGRLAAWRSAGLQAAIAEGTAPYRDPEAPIDSLEPRDARPPAGRPLSRRIAGRLRRMTSRASTPSAASPATDAAPQSHIAALLLARRFGATPIRASAGGTARYVRSLDDGSVHRLNRSAAFFLESAGSGRTVEEVLDEAARAFPARPPEDLLRDAHAAIRALTERGLLAPVPTGLGHPDGFTSARVSIP